MSYVKGDLIRCRGTFSDESGTLVDPATVTVRVKDPAGTATSYVYGAGAVVKDATGRYHLDVNANLGGRWTFRFESTGTYQAAAEQSLEVDAGAF